MLPLLICVTLIHNYSKSVSKAEIFDNLTNSYLLVLKGEQKRISIDQQFLSALSQIEFNPQ